MMIQVSGKSSFWPCCMMERREADGCAVAEFALVLPIIVMIALGLFDCYDYFRTQEILSMVVREIGNAAFRTCPGKEPGAAMNECLARVAGATFTADALSPGITSRTKIVVQAVRYNAGNPSSPLFEGEYRAPGAISRYTTQEIAGSGSARGLYSYNAKKGILITVEALHQRKVFSQLFPEELYQTAIY